MESVEENENNPNSDEPNSYGLQETPIYNYSGDAEIEQDFHDGWYWAYLPNKEDTGSEYGPFLEKQQLLLDPWIKNWSIFSMRYFPHLCLKPLPNLRADICDTENSMER